MSARILISRSWDIYDNRVKELDLEVVGGGSKLEESCTMAEISHELSSPLFPPLLITHILYFLFSCFFFPVSLSLLSPHFITHIKFLSVNTFNIRTCICHIGDSTQFEGKTGVHV